MEAVNLGLNLEEESVEGEEEEGSSSFSDRHSTGSTSSQVDHHRGATEAQKAAVESSIGLEDEGEGHDDFGKFRQQMAQKRSERGNERRRLFAPGNQVRRLVDKNGDSNVKGSNVQKRNWKYMSDIFTTLVDMRWRYHALLFALTFLLTWFCFGGVWYVVCVFNPDLFYRPGSNQTQSKECVENVFDFSSAFLFSIETQMTIGFGYRVIQPNCHLGMFIMMVQSCIGLFIQSVITGIIFSKISRPKGRAQTIMFSERAAVCKRDGQYCLTFRVGDMRKSHIIGTSIRALLVKNRLTTEGESIPLCQFPLSLETETSGTDSFVILMWPVTVVHRIDSTSPLWDLCPAQLLTDHFEIIVILEGTVESTGMSTQVRTSYVPSEIVWGERLVPLLTFVSQSGRFEIDYRQFHQTFPMTMPDCCARDYADRRRELDPDELSQGSDAPVSFVALKKLHPSSTRHSMFLRSHSGLEKND